MNILFELSVPAFIVLKTVLHRSQFGKVIVNNRSDFLVQMTQLKILRGCLGDSWMERIVKRELDRKIAALDKFVGMGAVVFSGILPSGGFESVCDLAVLNDAGLKMPRSEPPAIVARAD